MSRRLRKPTPGERVILARDVSYVHALVDQIVVAIGRTYRHSASEASYARKALRRLGRIRDRVGCVQVEIPLLFVPRRIGGRGLSIDEHRELGAAIATAIDLIDPADGRHVQSEEWPGSATPIDHLGNRLIPYFGVKFGDLTVEAADWLHVARCALDTRFANEYRKKGGYAESIYLPDRPPPRPVPTTPLPAPLPRGWWLWRESDRGQA